MTAQTFGGAQAPVTVQDNLARHFADMQVTPYGHLDFPHHTPLKVIVDSQVELTMRVPACAKEPETCRWINECVRPDDVFYDIGANVGSYSLVAAALGANVIAFEPQPQAYRQLVRNLQLNGQLNTVPLPIALGSVERIGSIVPDSPLSGSSARLDYEGGWLPVLVMRLERVVSVFALPAPAHLKIDTDGGELAVLAGSGALLQTVQSVMIESAAENEEVVTKCLQAAGLNLVSRHPRIAADVANLRFQRS